MINIKGLLFSIAIFCVLFFCVLTFPGTKLASNNPTSSELFYVRLDDDRIALIPENDVKSNTYKEVRDGSDTITFSNWTKIDNSQIFSFSSIASLPNQSFGLKCADSGGTKSIILYKIGTKNNFIIIPESNNDLCYEFSQYSNGESCLIATPRELWKFEGRRNTFTKISKDNYNGKNYDALLPDFLNNNNDMLYWNIRPMVNSNGTHCVYSSNKDCEATKGYSLWQLDLKTGIETILCKSDGAYMNCIGWLDNNTILVESSKNNKRKFVLVITSGESYPIEIPGVDPIVLGIGKNGRIILTDNQQKQLHMITISMTGKLQESLLNADFEAFICSEGSFNEKQTLFAFRYSNLGETEISRFGILDLKSNVVFTLPDWPLKQKGSSIGNIKWLDDSALLVEILCSDTETFWKYTVQ